MKNITPLLDPKVLVDIVQGNAERIARSIGVHKDIVTAIAINHVISGAGQTSTPVKKFNFIGIIQIPYFKDEDFENIKKKGLKKTSSSLLDIKIDQSITAKDNAKLGIEDIFLIDSSSSYMAEIQNDGYSVMAQNYGIRPRYRLKLVVGDFKINRSDFQALSITINNEALKQNRIMNFYPIISIFSLDDTIITISNSILQLDLSRRMNSKYVKNEDLKVVRFKMKLPKESPNIGGVVELIKLCNLKIKIIAACQEIIIENIQDLFD